jgi:hypothetical protein
MKNASECVLAVDEIYCPFVVNRKYFQYTEEISKLEMRPYQHFSNQCYPIHQRAILN